MKQYDAVEILIMRLESDDVITASGPFNDADNLGGDINWEE